ncbi:MAG: FAD-dependent oxidoreductase [Candidatus Margulisbacteria bacterium]|nr:FAD-dependent oxidoreductase [Candidatus Margulisiibacteriota bacterium]
MGRITINSKEYQFKEGQTILDVCTKNEIFIPTLCHVKELEPYGSCFVCVVEVTNGRAGIYPACSTGCMDGMIVETENDRIRGIRKMALELLMSDHFGDCVAPCSLEGCPANINIQGFLALEKEGKYQEAAQLIRKKAPMPNMLGRVCPAPCEKVCRRNRVDEAVSIRIQKRYISDKEIEQGGPFLPSKQAKTDKKITIIGAGPTGMSAAYYLALEGHEVTVYEAHPKHGGMTRYGIPYYRLPEDIIDTELDAIVEQLGVKMFYNTTIGKDIKFEEILNKSDAVLIAIGAQTSTSMDIPGESSVKVISAVEYLEKTAKHTPIALGANSLIVGGGHTAMDAARTAVRTGTKTTVIYRRSEEEMPGKDEIEEAVEEGVVFQFLSAPIKCEEVEGKLKVTCIKMGLSEPDNTGRRKPFPISGSEYVLTADTMVMAIGQKVEASFVASELISKRGTLEIDKKTYQTKNPKIFAAGDCVSGPDLVVTAVAAGRKSAFSIDQYLKSEIVTGEKPLFSSVTGELNELPDQMFAEYAKVPRMKIPQLSQEKRKASFSSIELTSPETMIQAEAERCLSCGCVEINDCKLKEYCEIYDVETQMFAGENRTYAKDKSQKDVVLEEDKCINCASCIRVAEANKNNKMLGLINRGFSSRVKPPFNEAMKNIDATAYQEVVKNCPTAGIRLAGKKIDYLKE